MIGEKLRMQVGGTETWVMHLMDPSSIKAQEPESLKSLPEKNCSMFCRSTWKLQTTWRNTRLYYTVYIAKEIGIKHIICCGDSDLVAQQVAGTWNARNSVMAAYRDEVDEIAKCFLGYEVKGGSISGKVLATIPAWTQPFLDYLIDQKLPEDEVLARQIVRRARSYTIVDGQLYKRSATGVFLKCVSNQDGIEILREIHAGDCGHHAASRSLVAKAFG
ncbi:hypothetical protein QYE76_022992 [Lolium multiflorum]|uniref:Uncharacterized protein n=1 Tax=Lolium multiflorum TaxID=4521 RepID=A0AAD8R9N0_LOLMU|nr:hypothetical protein QYE76_022992 [Lolium multiflorum]